MSSFTDLTQHEAVATSLLSMVPTACVGAFTHYRLGNVALPIAGVLALTNAVGMYTASHYFAKQIKDDYLRMGFCAILSISAIKMLIS